MHIPPSGTTQHTLHIYRKLWDTRWAYVLEHFKGFTVYAWCKPMSLPLSIEKGFKTGDTCVYVEKKIAK